MEKSRAISDAELLKEGAEFDINEKGEKNLKLTEKQIEAERYKMENPAEFAEKQAIIDAFEDSLQYDDYASYEELRANNPKLWKEEYFAQKAVEIDPRALKYFSPEIRSNRDVVLSAVRKDGLSLEFASPELQDDEEVVLRAMEQVMRDSKSPYCKALKFASERLRHDPDVIYKYGCNGMAEPENKK